MAKARKHKHLEFHVDRPAAKPFITNSFDEAAGMAISLAASNGRPVNLDVVCWDVAAARVWGGDEGVEQYREDPEASVFERIVVRADAQGRVR